MSRELARGRKNEIELRREGEKVWELKKGEWKKFREKMRMKKLREKARKKIESKKKWGKKMGQM